MRANNYVGFCDELAWVEAPGSIRIFCSQGPVVVCDNNTDDCCIYSKVLEKEALLSLVQPPPTPLILLFTGIWFAPTLLYGYM